MRALFLGSFLLATVTACEPAPKTIFVADAQVRLPAVSGRPGAAFFTLKGGPTEDRLMAVTSPLAVRTELHDMVMSGNVMRMTPIEGGVLIPAGGEVRFESGGKHVMLFDLSPKAQAGSKLPIEFRFSSGTVLNAEAEIVAAGAAADDHH